MKERIPKIYEPVTWRCVLRVCPESGNMGLGFNRPDGSVIRVKIPKEDALKLADSIHDFVFDHIRSQSRKSSGKPSSSVSTGSEVSG